MAKNDAKLDLPEIAVETAAEAKPNVKKKKEVKGKKPTAKNGKKFNLIRVFREMFSELKKVEWAHFKQTKNNPGVLSQTGIVLVVVLFFAIVIAAFDSGLLALLQLLLKSASTAA